MSSRTALVVDDSTSMRELVSFTLRQAGFTVAQGSNGQEGLAQLEKTRFDLVITDLNMPVMDGITFIRHARASANGKHAPILMLTTESQAEKKQQGKAAGATGWMSKPFQPEKLLQVIRKVLP